MHLPIFTIIMGMAFLGLAHVVHADNTQYADNQKIVETPTNKFQKLGLQNGKVIPLTDAEAAEASKQAVEGFQKQLDMSDPEVKAAILKAQQELQKKKEQANNQNDTR